MVPFANTSGINGRTSVKNQNNPKTGLTPQFYQKKHRLKAEKIEGNTAYQIHNTSQNPKKSSVTSSVKRLSVDAERLSNKSSNNQTGIINMKGLGNHININLMNNLNNINQTQSNHSHSHSMSHNNGNGSLGNSMLQGKKVTKKKDIDVLANATSNSNNFNMNNSHGSSMHQRHSNAVPRQNLNQKLVLQNQIINASHNSVKYK